MLLKSLFIYINPVKVLFTISNGKYFHRNNQVTIKTLATQRWNVFSSTKVDENDNGVDWQSMARI